MADWRGTICEENCSGIIGVGGGKRMRPSWLEIIAASGCHSTYFGRYGCSFAAVWLSCTARKALIKSRSLKVGRRWSWWTRKLFPRLRCVFWFLEWAMPLLPIMKQGPAKELSSELHWRCSHAHFLDPGGTLQDLLLKYGYQAKRCRG